MKSAMLVVMACLLILLPGCAQQPVTHGAHDRIDYQQMAAVEQRAGMLGVKVYWVHPPEKAGSTRRQ